MENKITGKIYQLTSSFFLRYCRLSAREQARKQKVWVGTPPLSILILLSQHVLTFGLLVLVFVGWGSRVRAGSRIVARIILAIVVFLTRFSLALFRIGAILWMGSRHHWAICLSCSGHPCCWIMSSLALFVVRAASVFFPKINPEPLNIRIRTCARAKSFLSNPISRTYMRVLVPNTYQI